MYIANREMDKKIPISSLKDDESVAQKREKPLMRLLLMVSKRDFTIAQKQNHGFFSIITWPSRDPPSEEELWEKKPFPSSLSQILVHFLRLATHHLFGTIH